MCPRFADLVRRYNVGRVSRGEARQVEAHFKVCYECLRAAAKPLSRRELTHSPILKKSRPVAAWVTLVILGGLGLAALSGKLPGRRGWIPAWPAAASSQR